MSPNSGPGPAGQWVSHTELGLRWGLSLGPVDPPGPTRAPPPSLARNFHAPPPRAWRLEAAPLPRRPRGLAVWGHWVLVGHHFPFRAVTSASPRAQGRGLREETVPRVSGDPLSPGTVPSRASGLAQLSPLPRVPALCRWPLPFQRSKTAFPDVTTALTPARSSPRLAPAARCTPHPPPRPTVPCGRTRSRCRANLALGLTSRNLLSRRSCRHRTGQAHSDLGCFPLPPDLRGTCPKSRVGRVWKYSERLTTADRPRLGRGRGAAAWLLPLCRLTRTARYFSARKAQALAEGRGRKAAPSACRERAGAKAKYSR